jgi:hypothetical protein
MLAVSLDAVSFSAASCDSTNEVHLQKELSSMRALINPFEEDERKEIEIFEQRVQCKIRFLDRKMSTPRLEKGNEEEVLERLNQSLDALIDQLCCRGSSSDEVTIPHLCEMIDKLAGEVERSQGQQSFAEITPLIARLRRLEEIIGAVNDVETNPEEWIDPATECKLVNRKILTPCLVRSMTPKTPALPPDLAFSQDAAVESARTTRRLFAN